MPLTFFKQSYLYVDLSILWRVASTVQEETYLTYSMFDKLSHIYLYFRIHEENCEWVPWCLRLPDVVATAASLASCGRKRVLVFKTMVLVDIVYLPSVIRMVSVNWKWHQFESLVWKLIVKSGLAYQFRLLLLFSHNCFIISNITLVINYGKKLKLKLIAIIYWYIESKMY